MMWWAVRDTVPWAALYMVAAAPAILFTEGQWFDGVRDAVPFSVPALYDVETLSVMLVGGVPLIVTRHHVWQQAWRVGALKNFALCVFLYAASGAESGWAGAAAVSVMSVASPLM